MQLKDLPLPEVVGSERELDTWLTRPTQALIDFIPTVPSPLVILGAGGKMGPTLAVLARNAAALAGHSLDVIAVSRFRDAKARGWLEQQGVQVIECDLFSADLGRRLPDATEVIHLVGLKFGTMKDPSTTWATNTLLPAQVAERYRGARIVALSTGNVYPMCDVSRGGSVENDPLTPLGEYANAAVARERIFDYCSKRFGTPIALLRLYYALDLRYGVLADIARSIQSGQPVELANGYFSCIWQADANEMIIRALSLATSPPSAWNLCHPEVQSVRAVATRLGDLLGRPPRFTGSESPTATIGNSARLCGQLGTPATPLDVVLRWTANWVQQGGRDLGRPTHFEVRNGVY